jgi:hypothetical protein
VKIKGKMSTFGGPHDTGVAAYEGLSLITRSDLVEWWFSRIFLNTQPVGTSGLARRLNPEAFYIAMRWGDRAITNSMARRALFRLTANVKSIFAQAADFGPAVRTKRVVDMSPGAANALGLTTDDEVEVEMIS